ncbi:DeoR/GlpR family DNA-binding transcription regulator [Paludifilum halophilum]|uniref:DeoR family transcriptional regulator n=1 Tax=Paludifilum halophilum TaxID=1642702 RepID=A0A235B6J4_9BACL|nr:DeoR/GlpR family DNA-binding transcription regulator [Paludifilum halophilum]OYD07609.1 DeoR family transcriptional regulator [Paludifilum halophilum]
MYQEERMLAIMDHLKKHQRVSVQELCNLFNISRDTARRDLVRLDQEGAIIRTRGGAILPQLTKEVKGYKERLQAESIEKQEIGRLAASLVQDGDYLIMDASTTVQFAAAYLEAEEVVVVTNSIDIADILTEKEGVDIHLLGGHLHKKHRYVFGASTIEKLADFKVDKVFLGASGITEDGLFYPHEEDGYVIRRTLRCADQVIVLADATKFNRKLFHRVCDLEEIDQIVTDRHPPEEIMQVLREKNVDVMGRSGTF